MTGPGRHVATAAQRQAEVLAELSGDYGQTVHDVRRRLLQRDAPVIMSSSVVRDALNALVAAGVAERRPVLGRVPTGKPGIIAARVVQHWRLRGDGGDQPA